MQPTELKTKFSTIKKSVKTAKPADVLIGIGLFVKDILGLLAATCDHVPITWKGKGTKTYEVFVAKGTKIPFSRAANVDLFINDPTQFETQWKAVLASLEICSKAKTGKLVHEAVSLDGVAALVAGPGVARRLEARCRLNRRIRRTAADPWMSANGRLRAASSST